MSSIRSTSSRNIRATPHRNTFVSWIYTGLAPFTAGLSARLHKRFSRFSGRRQTPRQTFGRWGEREAAKYLRQNGYKILFRNFRGRRGEIDLICRDRRAGVLVFVEVKSRQTEAFGPPHFAVSLQQQTRVVNAAAEWLRLLDDRTIPYRFDIVEVVGRPLQRIRQIRNAFDLPNDIYR
jgi:putative endonuclease